MNYVILGDGLLGKELHIQTGWNYVSRKKDNIDISKESFFSSLDEYDSIINCIAFTDTYSEHRDSNWDINVKFLDNLIDYCNQHNKKLIHISTDYVYAGSVENASEEDVPVHINTWYGYTKLVGDALVQLRSKNYLVCRLSHKPYPFPYEYAWTDMKTNGDYVNVIARLVINLVAKNATGLFNVGTEPKTIFELAERTTGVKKSNKPDIVPNNTTMNIEKLKSC